MNTQTSKATLSGVFSTSRIYCLISIVSAHLSFPGTFSQTVLARFSLVGVVGFLVMAGYFYKPAKFGSFVGLLKKKAISIGLPWIVFGFLTWLYNAILVPERRNLVALLKWIFGNGSFLYYMTVIVICFIVFYRYNKFTLCGAILINIASVIFTATGLLKPIIDVLHISDFLNVFNWVGFFAAGMLLQQIDEHRLLAFLVKYRILFIIAFGVCFVVSIIFKDVSFTYFSYLAIPFELIGVWAFFSLSTFQLTNIKLFSNLSDASFTIYLVHMIFVGFLDGLLSKFEISRLLSPLVIIAVTFVCLMIGLWVSRKIKLDKVYCLVTGLRIK